MIQTPQRPEHVPSAAVPEQHITQCSLCSSQVSLCSLLNRVLQSARDSFKTHFILYFTQLSLNPAHDIHLTAVNANDHRSKLIGKINKEVTRFEEHSITKGFHFLE